MSQNAIYTSIHPIGDTDPQNLPVPSIAQAAPFYLERMGFTLRAPVGSKIYPITSFASIRH